MERAEAGPWSPPPRALATTASSRPRGPAPAALASARVRRRQARRTPSTSTAELAAATARCRPRLLAAQAGLAGQLGPALTAVGGQPLGHHRLGLEALRQPGSEI